MTTAVDVRTLPHDIEAEKAVIGAVILHPESLFVALESVKPGHFYRQAHRWIFDAIVRLHEKGSIAEFVTLRSELERVGQLDGVGGPAYIASLVNGLPRSTNLEHYARIVRDAADLRLLIDAAHEIADAAYARQEDAAVIRDRAEQILFEVSRGTQGAGYEWLGDVVKNDTMPLIEHWHANKGQLTGVPSGFVELDNLLLGGFQKQDMVIVGARPSMGKTAFAMDVARAAAGHGLTVGVFSLEMGKRALALRELSAESAINGMRLRRGYLGAKDWTRLSEAINETGRRRIAIWDAADLNVWDMRSKARRLKAEHGLDLILIDYVQLIHGHLSAKSAEYRTQELTAISRALKGMAKALDVPVIALSQVSRAVDARSDKRPLLSDLRESGALEQDADVVMFLYRDAVYNDTADEGIAEIIVAKQRNGPIGNRKLAWIPEQTRFVNLAQETSAHQPMPGDR